MLAGTLARVPHEIVDDPREPRVHGPSAGRVRTQYCRILQSGQTKRYFIIRYIYMRKHRNMQVQVSGFRFRFTVALRRSSLTFIKSVNPMDLAVKCNEKERMAYLLRADIKGRRTKQTAARKKSILLPEERLGRSRHEDILQKEYSQSGLIELIQIGVHIFGFNSKELHISTKLLPTDWH